MLVNNRAPDNAPSLGKAKRLQQPTHLTAPAPDCDRDIRHDQNGDQEDDLEVDQEDQTAQRTRESRDQIHLSGGHMLQEIIFSSGHHQSGHDVADDENIYDIDEKMASEMQIAQRIS